MLRVDAQPPCHLLPAERADPPRPPDPPAPGGGGLRHLLRAGRAEAAVAAGDQRVRGLRLEADAAGTGQALRFSETLISLR